MYIIVFQFGFVSNKTFIPISNYRTYYILEFNSVKAAKDYLLNSENAGTVLSSQTTKRLVIIDAADIENALNGQPIPILSLPFYL